MIFDRKYEAFNIPPRFDRKNHTLNITFTLLNGQSINTINYNQN